jgi:CRP-like cAMP-binding protein
MIDYEWLEQQMQCPALDEKQRQLLDDVIQEQSLPSDVPVIHQGRGGRALYLLYAGSVRIVRKRETGEKVELLAPQGLKLFGEMSFFSDEPASADVVTDQHCTIYRIDHERFEQLQKEAPDVAMDLMTMVVRNMGATIRRLDSKFAHIY